MMRDHKTYGLFLMRKILLRYSKRFFLLNLLSKKLREVTVQVD